MARGRCHPHALLLLLLAAALAGAPPGGLYSPGDPLVLLQVDTLESSVLNSSSAWLVEFYASWCGHCVHFAPIWRALAADIQEWSPAVNVAVVDCADIANQKMCGKFGITGFPTLKRTWAGRLAPKRCVDTPCDIPWGWYPRRLLISSTVVLVSSLCFGFGSEQQHWP
uniref:Thioredoxin domain-containing protein n=1 Tax=Terrapene triunguis TaxID=2587831 RepID=A0A674JYB6_9SAUR